MGTFWIDQGAVIDACVARIGEAGARPKQDEVERCLTELRRLLADARLAPGSKLETIIILVESQLRAGNTGGAIKSIRHAVPERARGPALIAARAALPVPVVIGALVVVGVWLWSWPWSLLWVVMAVLALIGLGFVALLGFGWRHGRANPHWREASGLCDAVKALAGSRVLPAALDRYRTLRALVARYPEEKGLVPYRTAAAMELSWRLDAVEHAEEHRMLHQDIAAATGS